ncbi:leucine-rich repeat domain-containing protein [Porphyromonas gingivicanis]|uniref:leucine-rich repeat domain-containing protein n=1 Tax=Porphyromonas gingivicanis TaxID=266762 RepID=UPI00047112B2|nr:hypothetical protein [Porphyromonas gingivicanis]
MNHWIKKRVVYQTLLIALLSSIYASPFFAQHRVTMTTKLKVGTKINRDDFWVNEKSKHPVTFEGIKKLSEYKYEVTAQEIIITGNITELTCSDVKLTALDVTQAPELQSLDCRSNSLSTLNLNNNNKLTYLACGKNNLTSLSLKKKKDLRLLNCSKSPSLSSVDLSDNSALRSLYIHECPSLKELDLTANTELEVLHGFQHALSQLDLSKNTLLETLNIYNGKLKELNLSNNHKLHTLSCYNNELTSLLVSSQASFLGIHIQNNRLDRGAMYEFIKSLPNNTEKPINIFVVDSEQSNTPHKNECSKTLVSVAKRKGFVMYDFKGSESVEYPGIDGYPTLSFTTETPINENISLQAEGDNPLVYDGLEELSNGTFKVLSSDVIIEGNLKKLSVGKSKLTALDASSCSTLSAINCSNNSLSRLNFEKNQKLEWLNCSANSINEENMSALIASLPDRSSQEKKGNFYVIDLSDSNQPEGNVCTKEQVAAVKTRGWIPQQYKNEKWSEYEGSEAIDNRAITMTTKKAVGETITLEIKADGAFTVEGATLKDGKTYTLTATDGRITIKGDVTSIECQDNQLTQLDVSKNTMLEKLSCFSNQLTLLDVSKNTELKGVICFKNQLTQLDVSKNTKLEVLNCAKNKIAQLDVSKNIELKGLNCTNNPLNRLDVSNNINLEWLSCANNQLSGLDASKNTKLEELICWGNLFTQLDVSKNTKLNELDCSFNQLTQLDVSKNTKLEQLNCEFNQLTQLDVVQNRELKDLACFGNSIKSQNMGILISSLPDRSNQERKGNFYVVCFTDSEEYPEGNVCTKKQVAAAKIRGWIPQEYKNEQWNEYEGSEDVAIDDVLAQEEATIVAIYNVDGHRISELQEGVNIIRLSNGNVLKVLHRAK